MSLNTLDLAATSPLGQEAAPPAALGHAAPPAAAAAAFALVLAQTRGKIEQAVQALEPEQATPGATSQTVLSLCASAVSADGAGQELASPPAAGSDAAPLPVLETPALPLWVQGWPSSQAVEQIDVGPSLKAITVKAPAPSDDSLAAFAQAQGLDAHAIAWLMGDASKPAPAAVVGEIGSSVTLHAQQTPDMPAGSQAAMGIVTSPTSPALGSMAGLASSVWTGAAHGTPLPSAQTSASGAQAALASAPTPTPTPTPAPAAAPARSAALQTGLLAAAAWAPTVVVQSSMRSAAIASDSVSGQGWPLEMQSNLAMVHLPSAKRLGTGPAFSDASPVGSNFTSTPPTTWLESELDLTPLAITQSDSTGPEPFAGPVTDASPQGMPQPAARAHAAPTDAGPMPAAPKGDANAQLASSDRAQQLADQMADAIGERMVRELERGHWNLRLMLKPAHLGHIEVEMRMRAGELDARFVVQQAGTRELLQEGLGRLKDSLNHLGMDVASLDVKNGQNRQNGGDSTPRHAPSTTPLSQREATEMPVQPTSATPHRPRRTDGWDVMV